MTALPMFPLGTVLFPSVYLPLHVFEPRYRELTRVCLAGNREFGVVLIERGSEVGGDDVRTDVGTVARIIEATELADGRWVLGTIGSRRIRVLSWLSDDPYPRADVEDWEDEPAAVGDARLTSRYQDVLGALRRVLALKAELGEPAAKATVELATDPVLGSYQVAAAAPIGPADQFRLLGAPGALARLELAAALLDEEAGFLERRLALG